MEKESTFITEVEDEVISSGHTFDEKFKNFTLKTGQYASGLLAFGVAIWWIFYGTIEIVPTTLSLSEKLGLVFATIILTVSYCKLISHGGFKSAKETSAYKHEAKMRSEIIHRVIGDRQAIIRFAKDEARQNLIDLIKENFENNELLYSEFYDSNDNFIGLGYKKRKDLTRHQKKVVAKMLKLKIKIPNLFGSSSSKVLGLQREESQRMYETKTDAINVVIRSILAFVSVGFMFNFIGFSLGSMIFALFQIVLWTLSGFAQRIKNYDWVLTKGIQQMIEKRLVLEAWEKLNPELKKKYTKIQEDEIDKILSNVAEP